MRVRSEIVHLRRFFVVGIWHILIVIPSMRILVEIFLAGILATPLTSQTKAQFEVTSLKRHPEPVNVSRDPTVSGNRVNATAITLVDLLTVAYLVKYDQISGGPDWVRSDHYDLTAKAEGDGVITQEELRRMLQSMLAERFSLVIHRELKDVPAYALVVGKKGAQLIETSATEPGKSFVRANASGVHIEQVKGSMDELARQLSMAAGRPVIDKTNLNGRYKFAVDFTPVDRVVEPGSDIPDLFTAVQEKLGLKLEPTRASVDMLIINQASRPSAN